MIRKATYLDAPRIWALMQEAHAISRYKDIPLCPDKNRKIIATLISSPTQFAWVDEVNGEVNGVLLGVVDEWARSRKKMAGDEFFYVNEKSRCAGYFLARKFIKLMSDRPDVKIIGLSNSSGIGDTERTEQFYRRLGLERVGGIYLK